MGRLRRDAAPVHFANHHHARYGPFLNRPYAVLALDRVGIHRTSAVIAVSEHTRREVLRHLRAWPTAISVIYPGLDTARFRPVPPASLPYPYLLFVGSEHPHKHIASLLALPEIAGRAAEVCPSNPAAIAAATARLLEDEARRAGLVKKGLDHVRQFTWARAASRTEAIYASVRRQPTSRDQDRGRRANPRPGSWFSTERARRCLATTERRGAGCERTRTVKKDHERASATRTGIADSGAK